MILSLLVLIISLQAVPQIEDCWTDDFTAAQESALEEEKPLLLVFTGSDWCRSCMKLEKEVLETDAFNQYVGEHFIAYRVDLPRNKKALAPEMRELHQELLKLYNPKGSFPFLVLLDGEESLWSSGYLEGGPKIYLNQWNSM